MEQAGRRGREAADEDGPSDQLVLAAVRRAALHEGGQRGAVPLRAVLAHLGIAPRSARGRELRRRVERLGEAALLRQARAHGVVVWSLAEDGARMLDAAEARGWRPALPESPQHRAWRSARAAAERELDRFAAELTADIHDAGALLDALAADSGHAPPSDAWLTLGPRLLGDCRRLGSAWHCLHEWPEPSDEAADGDPGAREPLRAGRRNIALWARRP